MNIVILGMDGLEYNLVLKWNLKNLMQKTFGSIKIGKEYYGHGVPYTPIVWTSFMTGQKPVETGVREWWSYGKILEKIRYKPPFIWFKNKRRFLMKLGIKPRVLKKGQWNSRKSFFEVIDNSIPIYIPGYNSPDEYHLKLMKAISYEGSEKYARVAWEWHEKKKKKVLESLGKYKLIMVWLDISDVLGHIWFVKHPLKLMMVYKDLNIFAKKVQDNVDENTIILIVSDHGMEDSGDGVTGNHSDHNFWSLNIETNWKPNDITDYYPMIMEWCEK